MTFATYHARQQQAMSKLDDTLANMPPLLSSEPVMKWTCDADGNWFQVPAHTIDGPRTVSDDEARVAVEGEAA